VILIISFSIINIFSEFTLVNVIGRLEISLVVFALFLIHGLYRNGALRKQRILEDGWEDSMYLSFWAKLILFPLYLRSEKPFKHRTIKYRIVNLISFVVIFLFCLLPIDRAIRTSIAALYFFWLFILMIIFKQQEHRGFIP